MTTPTKTTYFELQAAYDHFNDFLFGSQLPQCLITLQRKKKTYGYFFPDRFTSHGGTTTDEIAMNPAYFAISGPEEVMQTLAHEMVHLWQHHFGKAGRRGYHNKEWAGKMEEIGLMPSSTGKPGGKKTGDCMSDYVIPGGQFECFCQELLTDNFRISWADKFPDREKILSEIQEGNLEPVTDELSAWGIEIDDEGNLTLAPDDTSTRSKFTCPTCGINVWGKPNLTKNQQNSPPRMTLRA